MNNISILIPTVQYNQYLDLAIESCFKAKYITPKIFVNINSYSKEFKNSRYWNDNRISWRQATKPGVSMYENVNDAIFHSYGEWLFVLSDDDIIKENFMKGINLENENTNFLYCVNQIEIIDENGNKIHENSRYIEGETYTNDEIMPFFFQEYIRHHISAICFSRTLTTKLNYFSSNCGYPNGYYGDYIFFGKAFANCEKVFMSNEIVFSRRETSTQGSAKFYFKDINSYFNIIVNDLCSNKEFNKYVKLYYGNKHIYKIEMMKHRATIEWTKLQNKTYNTSKIKFFKFLYYLITKWEVPIPFKFCFTTAKISSTIFPKKIDLFYKKNIHSRFCKIKKYF